MEKFLVMKKHNLCTRGGWVEICRVSGAIDEQTCQLKKRRSYLCRGLLSGQEKRGLGEGHGSGRVSRARAWARAWGQVRGVLGEN